MYKAVREHELFFLLLVTFLCLGISTSLFCTRKLPFIDEVWSYMLSNKMDSPFLCSDKVKKNANNDEERVLCEPKTYKSYFNHWYNGLYYRNAITVQPEERFSYDRVYYNQTLDVHPPLYYFLLHTVCSFFPNQFSWWFAYVINVVFFAGTIPLLFFVAREIGLRPSHALLASSFWGLSASGLNDACFLRMYMMLTFLMLCVTYWQVRLLKRFDVRYVIIIFALDILGFLTHHYAYIYVFFLTLFYVTYMLCGRKSRCGILYGLATLSAVGVAVAVFPAVLKHAFFSGYWSVDVANGIHSPLYMVTFIETLRFIFKSYTGHGQLSSILYSFLGLICFFLTLCFLLVLISFNIRKYRKLLRHSLNILKQMLKNLFVDSEYAGHVLIVLSAFATAYCIIKISPSVMADYRIRYLLAVLPFFSIITISIIGKLLVVCRCKENTANALLCLIVVGCIITSNIVPDNYVLLRNMHKDDNSYQAYFKNSCVVLVDDTYFTQAFIPSLIYAKEVYIADSLLSEATTSVLKKNIDYLMIVNHSLMSNEDTEKYLMQNVERDFTYISDYYCTVEDLACYSFYKIHANSDREGREPVKVK